VALLNVNNLEVSFLKGDSPFYAVREVSFSVHHGKTVCIVGESGSGKSLTALSIMGLLPRAASLAGEISFEGDPVTVDRALHTGHRYCGKGMAMVFQEPMASLNPSATVEQIVGEALRLRLGVSRAGARQRVCDTLKDAGISDPAALLKSYPWQLSGGLAQRVMIASALILQPKLLIADEPTTALDVTTQAQILRLLVRLRNEKGLAMLFITHDLSIAGLMGGVTMVMHEGDVVERGPTKQVLSEPEHRYTRKLVACCPGYALKSGRSRLTPEAER